MSNPLLDLDGILSDLIDEMLIRVVERTPVDSGQAKESWVREDTGFSSYLPYINRLEDGYSDQAPNGMVRITLEESQDIFDMLVKKELE